jgi:ribonuclease HI
MLKSLDPVHNQGIRLATGAFSTSSIDSIMCNAGELPFQRRRQSSILQCTSKIKCLPDHISNIILHNTLPTNQIPNQCTIYENFKILSENLHLHDLTLSKVSSSLPPWLWTVNINTQLSELNKQNTPNKTLQNIFSQIISQHYSNHTQIYTDASKNINGTGFAVITENDSYIFSLFHYISIYTAETYTIYEAVKIAVSSNSENTIILSDYFSAITSIIKPYPKNELVQLIQKSLSTTNRNISFMWVPSHVGIPGNKKADTIANEAIISPSSKKINKITTSDAIYNIKKKTLELW